MRFNAPPRGRRQHHRQGPLLTIALQATPPRSPLQLQLDRFLGHELVLQSDVVPLQIQEKLSEGRPFGLGQFKSPSLPPKQDAEWTPLRIPRYAPAGTLLLNHEASASAGQQIRLILLIAQLDDGALDGLDTGLLQQAIEIVETTLLGPERDPNRGQVAVAGLTNQALAPLGEVSGVNPCRNHETIPYILMNLDPRPQAN